MPDENGNVRGISVPAKAWERIFGEKLIYAATARCPCGAGLAYEPHGESGRPMRGYWDCSAILKGEAIPQGDPGSVQHTAQLPFLFYEIKSEKQPSARGATTRPQ